MKTFLMIGSYIIYFLCSHFVLNQTVFYQKTLIKKLYVEENNLWYTKLRKICSCFHTNDKNFLHWQISCFQLYYHVFYLKKVVAF